MVVKLPMAARTVGDGRRYEGALRMAAAARAAPSRPAVAPPPPGAPLTDRHGRRIRYLRLSVTDRCNLRCTYCAPAGPCAFLSRGECLRDEEILEVLAAMAARGLEKVRFTGGEPLVRPGLLGLIERAARLPGLRLLCLSTNGLLLAPLAAELHAAGIRRFNVSLDSLVPERFRRLTGGGELSRVWRGIEAVLALGTAELKLNVVLMRGVNDDELEAFVELSHRLPIEVRFIELMPLAHQDAEHPLRFLPAAELVRRLERAGAEPLARGPADGPARLWRLPGAAGTTGVISPVSDPHFCDSCNRVRLGADGKLKLCLFGDAHLDLRAVLRAPGYERAALDAALDRALHLKPEKMAGFAGFTMMGIGG
ncbi:MAG: cyclic pyranopterin monophosphate synthase [Planctomycetota bacterium]|nr:MAG: cyclic pyranopterin monophosphate synthase [Planctomycetota bacterium]